MGGSNSKLLSDPAKLDNKTYDYVIIGGGTAGSVLAGRLSEDKDVSVLLIEAGKTNAGVLFSQIPLAFPKLYKSTYDWNYETVPQSALANRKLFWPRGKMLGGSSSINAVMYHHCSPSDFDEWGRLTESSSPTSTKWNYEIMRPYFLKSENFTPPTALSTSPSKIPKESTAKYAETSDSSHGLRASERRHTDLDLGQRGKGGPWQTSYGPFNTFAEDAIAASEKVGIPYLADFNTSKGTLGTAFFPGFVGANGQRSSAATAYLTPEVQARPNLTIITNTCVTGIYLNEDKTKVEYVEITKMPENEKSAKMSPTPSERWRVNVKKEAILSAGTVATPQILMLSGIGPREELEKVGIRPVKEVRDVGKNMIDHLMTVISFRAAANTTLGYLDKPLGGLMPLFRWLTTGGGIYSAIAVQSAAFIRMDDKNLPLESGIPASQPLQHNDNTSCPNSPDVELLYMAAPYLDHGLRPPPKGTEVFTAAGCLLKPESRGEVTLNSSNPFDKPLIDPKYLSSQSDLNIHRKFVRLILRVVRQDPLRKKIIFPESDKGDKTRDNVFWPGDADPERITDHELDDAIERLSETIYHPVGTCRMGIDAATSVVDTSLRMHGIPNLRVVDASIFPSQLSGHPTAPIIALAERAADLIRGTSG